MIFRGPSRHDRHSVLDKGCGADAMIDSYFSSEQHYQDTSYMYIYEDSVSIGGLITWHFGPQTPSPRPVFYCVPLDHQLGNVKVVN